MGWKGESEFICYVKTPNRSLQNSGQASGQVGQNWQKAYTHKHIGNKDGYQIREGSPVS